MTINMRFWEDWELERLLDWMETHRQQLRGPTNMWTGQAKEAINLDHIDARKIKSKYHNFRTAWKWAKKMQLESGLPRRKEDCSETINGRSTQRVPS